MLYSHLAVAAFSFNNRLIDFVDQGDISNVEALLRAGANVNSRGEFGVTPLMRAVYRGDYKMMELLLKFGADVDARDIGGATALHIASRQGQADMIKVLYAKSTFGEVQDLEGFTPSKRAVITKKTKSIEAFNQLHNIPSPNTNLEMEMKPAVKVEKVEEVSKESKENEIFLTSTPKEKELTLLDDSFDHILTQKSAHEVTKAQTRKRKIKVFSAEQLLDDQVSGNSSSNSSVSKVLIEQIKSEKQLDVLLHKLQSKKELKNKSFSIQIKEVDDRQIYSIEMEKFTAQHEANSVCKMVKQFNSQLLCYSLNN